MQRLQAVVEGAYVLEDELDRGARGAVYVAHDSKHRRKVAIKVMLPQVGDAVGVTRFLQEISIAARLNHPHILPLYDSGQADGLFYYVMPYVKGKSLKDRLNEVGRLPLDEVKRIAGEVGSALDRAHREGIIHRDIKPANILMVGNHASVADFGIARAMDAADNLAETGVGVFMGTAYYMSPEQASGSADLDGRSDQYSFGCTVFEMLAGNPPFPGPSLRQVLTQHIVSPVPSLRAIRKDVPEHVERAVEKALEKEPANRFATLIDFANALSLPETRNLWGRLRATLGTRTPDAAVVETPVLPTDSPNAVACPECGLEDTDRSQFCRRCGTRMAQQDDGRGTSILASPAEFRQLTVMYSDAMGSASLNEQLDADTTAEVTQEYARACEAAVRRFDGHIVQADARSMVAYFGYPVAHEDDPIRAGLAGLQILSAMRELSGRVAHEYHESMNVRIGIHTGSTLMDSSATDTHAEHLASGETPRFAALLRDEAPPDSVLVSDVTRRLFKGYFTCLEMGISDLESSSPPVLSYRLLSESGVGRLLESTSTLDLPPLVGRESELATILKVWSRAKEGTGQLTVLTGEAGMGKSRLLAAVRKSVVGQPHLLLQAGCSPYHTGTALYGVVRMLERWLGVHPDDPHEDRFAKLEALVPRYLEGMDEAVPLLAALLSIPPADDRYPPLELDPTHQRRRTLEVLLAMIRSAATQQPVLMIMDDLQWVDPSTLEFLNMWLDRARASPIMLLLASRPEFSSSWNAPNVTEINLAGLDDAEVADLISVVTGGRHLPAEIVEQITQRADGIPLFIEETTRTLLEAGHLVETSEGYEVSGPLPPTAIPLSLRDALTARIDQLGSAKSVVQLGAVIGRRFSANLLLDISDSGDWVTLSAELGRAVDAGVLVSSGAGPQATYSFRHALVQEHAYQSLVGATRQQHHGSIMEALENGFPGAGEPDPGHLAYHCTEAGAVERAIPYWRKAGQLGLARAELAESERHLHTGLKLLESLPEGTQRDLEEMEIQRTLGAVLQASKGYAAPEVHRAYARALALCKKGIASPDRLLPVLWGQHMFYTVRAQYAVSEEVARDMLVLAEKDGDSAHLLVSNLGMALSHLYQGDLVASRGRFRNALDHFEPESWPRPQLLIGEPRCISYSYLARTLWILGDVDEALELSLRSLTLARTLDEPSARVQALGMHTILLLLHRDDVQAHQYAAETVEHASRHGFSYWLILGSMFDASLNAKDGAIEEGIATFSHCLDLYQNQGAKLGLSWFFGTLAEMHGQNGDFDKASSMLDRARAHIEETEERYYEPEILRLQGEIALLRDGGAGRNAAEEAFNLALDVARRQNAISWELRASISLARLRRDQGRVVEAREALAMFGTMAKEFDPPADHREARLLIDELETE